MQELFKSFDRLQERCHMRLKWIQFWAVQMVVSAEEFLDIYEAETTYEAWLDLPDDGLPF